MPRFEEHNAIAGVDKLGLLSDGDPLPSCKHTKVELSDRGYVYLPQEVRDAIFTEYVLYAGKHHARGYAVSSTTWYGMSGQNIVVVPLWYRLWLPEIMTLAGREVWSPRERFHRLLEASLGQEWRNPSMPSSLELYRPFA